MPNNPGWFSTPVSGIYVKGSWFEDHFALPTGTRLRIIWFSRWPESVGMVYRIRDDDDRVTIAAIARGGAQFEPVRYRKVEPVKPFLLTVRVTPM